MSEPINEDYDEDETCSKKTDFMKIGGNLVSNINFKVAFFLFFIGMILFSDIFIDGVLRKIDGAVIDESTSTKGTLIQLTLLVILYLVVDLLNKYGWA